MAPTQTRKDYETFGQLIRQRRRALGLSQEALAAEALGNPDRKSFISAVENNRLTKITSNSAQKLCDPLGIHRDDVPASLRWLSADDPAPTEARLRALEAQQNAEPVAIDNRAIAQFLNAQMAAVLQRSMGDIYRERLISGLDILQRWMGRPFSLQSLLTCYALSLLYVVTAGALSSTQGGISIGSVMLFWTQDWASPTVMAFMPWVGTLILAIGVGLCWYLVHPLGLRSLSGQQTALRLAGVALIAGLCCGVVNYAGIQSLTAAAIFTVPSCAGISTLEPRRALLYGAVGGITFGMMAAISSALTDDSLILLLTSLSEGFIIGAIVGSCAGLASSLIARRMPEFRPGQLSAAGGGVAAGALVSLAGIIAASQFAAVTSGALGLFAVSWLALPLANAALDYISLGVSHRLGLYIIHSARRNVLILFALLLDLALAVALMVITVALVGLALASVDWVLGVETLSSAFLQASAAEPWGRGIWLTLMALSTTLWTWLHFGLVLAPLAAGAITKYALEKRAAKRLELARQRGEFVVSVGFLITLRFILFYLCWASVALTPVWLLVKYPETLETILWLGWRLAGTST